MIKKGIDSYKDNLAYATKNSKLFLLSCFFIFIGRGGLRVLFNLYIQNLGYSEEFIGSISSLRFIIAGIIAIPSAILATKIGYKKSLIISALLSILSISGIAIVDGRNLLILFNVIWGSSTMIVSVITAPFLVKNSTPEERSHLFGLNFAMIMITGMVGRSFFGFLVDLLKNSFDVIIAYKIVIFIIVALTAIGLIPLFFLKEKEIEAKDKINELIINIKDFIKEEESIKKLIIYSVFIGVGAGLIVPLFNIFLYNKLAATESQIGIIMAVANILTALGSLATPFLIARLGRIKTVVIPQMLSIIFLLMIAFTGNIYLVALAYSLRKMFMNMVNPVVRNFSMEIVTEENQANTSSIMRSVRRIGRGVGSFFSGIFLGSEMYIMPFIITAILYSTGFIFFAHFFKEYK
ncbi:MAG: MFS transporter [Bacillota bacterium]